MTSLESKYGAFMFRKNSDAIFQAWNLNYSNVKSREIYPEDRKMAKLKPLLSKAKRKQCLSPNEKEEHDRIKLLSKKVEIVQGKEESKEQS